MATSYICMPTAWFGCLWCMLVQVVSCYPTSFLVRKRGSSPPPFHLSMYGHCAGTLSFHISFTKKWILSRLPTLPWWEASWSRHITLVVVDAWIRMASWHPNPEDRRRVCCHQADQHSDHWYVNMGRCVGSKCAHILPYSLGMASTQSQLSVVPLWPACAMPESGDWQWTLWNSNPPPPPRHLLPSPMQEFPT